MLLRKGLKYLLIIGLLIILLGLTPIKTGVGIAGRALILVSKYRALMPYIVAQAKHETNGFKSSLYLKHNNMFGMKNGSSLIAGEKIGPVSPEGNTYASYNSDLDSLRDLLRWFEWTKFPTSVSSSDQYVRELKSRRYFGAPYEVYLKGVNYWLQK